ncbi:MAG TPA: phosphate signaling complex protein PhoU [Micromonosporaceae bacterium]|nr:phosphate signaling complex protein PhoU [Micromonosporaceae bacterium]
MREEFRAELAQVSRLLVEMADAARLAMRKATVALLEGDRTEAEQVAMTDNEIDALYRRVEALTYELLARQAPVASDLREVITALHAASDIERMGDLAEHIAEISLRRHPAIAVPEELRPVIREMAEVADRIAAKSVAVLSTADAVQAAELERDDDQMDELHRQLLAFMLGAAWRHGVEAAIDGALLGRYYERFADHAVNAGNQVVFFVTGETAAS